MRKKPDSIKVTQCANVTMVHTVNEGAEPVVETYIGTVDYLFILEDTDPEEIEDVREYVNDMDFNLICYDPQSQTLTTFDRRQFYAVTETNNCIGQLAKMRGLAITKVVIFPKIIVDQTAHEEDVTNDVHTARNIRRKSIQ